MDKEVVEKCLAFCQALTSNNQSFSFCLSLGSDTFNFSTKELVKSSYGKKKKKSPSQLRREARRREDRRRAETKTEDEDIAEVSEKSVAAVKPKCKHCDIGFNSEEELRAHIGSVHDTSLTSLPSPEKERGSLASTTCCELQGSPIHLQREEVQASDQQGTSYSFYEVGTQMCPVCDFEMCFPILDSIDISCKCCVGEDSR